MKASPGKRESSCSEELCYQEVLGAGKNSRWKRQSAGGSGAQKPRLFLSPEAKVMKAGGAQDERGHRSHGRPSPRHPLQGEAGRAQDALLERSRERTLNSGWNPQSTYYL